MGRNGILAQDVIAIAEQMVSKGEIPTIEKVRVILGTGSNSTIAKHLTEWKTTRLKADYKDILAHYAAPDLVNQAVAKVWQQLQEENQAKLETLEAKTAEKIQDVLEEKVQLTKENQQLVADNQDLRRLLQEMREKIAVLEKQHIHLNQTLAVIESKWKGAEEEKLSFHVYANKTLASLEEKHQQVIADSSIQLEQTKQFYSHELAQMKEIAESQRHKQIVEIDHLKTANQKLLAQLIEKDRALNSLTSRVGLLGAQLQNQQGSIADLLTSIQENEKMSVKLKEGLSQEVAEIMKQEIAKQAQKILSELKEQYTHKESRKPVKGKVK